VTKSRNIAKPRQPWSEADIELLRRNYATSATADLATALGRPITRIMAKASSLGLRKDPAAHAEACRQRMADPNHPGRQHQFKPGTPPANKGIKHRPGWAPGRMAAGQFKAGNKPHTWLPVGTLRVKDGYLERKVTDLPGSPSNRWHGMHRIVWEAANGPTPDGHVVVFKPGRFSTELAQITLDAVELISRAELMARNTRHNYSPEINELIGLRAQITRAVNTRAKQEESTP